MIMIVYTNYKFQVYTYYTNTNTNTTSTMIVQPVLIVATKVVLIDA